MLKYAKAIVGGLATGLATYSTFAADGNVSMNDWIAVLVAFIGATGLVYAVPNKQAA
jgi:fluoride ion exporter CrcB/FEX